MNITVSCLAFQLLQTLNTCTLAKGHKMNLQAFIFVSVVDSFHYRARRALIPTTPIRHQQQNRHQAAAGRVRQKLFRGA